MQEITIFLIGIFTIHTLIPVLDSIIAFFNSFINRVIVHNEVKCEKSKMELNKDLDELNPRIGFELESCEQKMDGD